MLMKIISLMILPKSIYVEWLVNSEAMLDIILEIPINRFLLNNPVTTEVDISVEEFFLILGGLVQLRKDKKMKVK